MLLDDLGKPRIASNPICIHPYCDFVLHSKVGQPCVIHMFKDVNVQGQILENTKKNWYNVYNVFAPKYFLMRVPRKLLPLVFE